jgi:hypothetical protein
VLLAGLMFVSGVAFGAPLIPTITSNDFNFGAFNQSGTVEYQTYGNEYDVLYYEYASLDQEVTAYWPDWPNNPVCPVYDVTGQNFGGDFGMEADFTGQDAQFGGFDVSLTGTWGFVAIYGTVTVNQVTYSGQLWNLALDKVSLYGYSAHNSYVLEGTGTIIGGYIAQANDLIGTPGAMRGHLDFQGPQVSWIPSLYDPLDPAPPLESIRAAYSGETGAVPEPATLLLLGTGLATLFVRRKKT